VNKHKNIAHSVSQILDSFLGENVTVRLYMEAQNGNDVISRNTISEINGDTSPEQVN